MEEEDFSEDDQEDSEDEDPLKRIIQSRYLFSFRNFINHSLHLIYLNKILYFQDFSLLEMIVDS